MIPAMNSKAILLVQVVCLLGAAPACAGKLQQPQRFAAAVKKYRGGTPPSTPVTGGSEDDAGEEPPACALDLFKSTCGQTSCHAKGSAQLDLVSAGVAARLIDQSSQSTTCDGHTYIATDGAASLLLDKLSDKPPCGAKMPLGGTISASNMQCLTTWVHSLGGETGGTTDADAGGAP